MIYDSVENIENYCETRDPVYKAVEFVSDFDLSQPDGRYEIDGDNIFAIVQSPTTVEARTKNFEAHQQYIDVQMVLQGCERQDVVLLNKENIKIIQKYDKEKDVMFFKEPQHFSTIILKPGMFVVYGTDDGHRPCCSIGKPQNIRKVCVKIKL